MKFDEEFKAVVVVHNKEGKGLRSVCVPYKVS